jgi:DNA polymerase-3 subunit alpha
MHEIVAILEENSKTDAQKNCELKIKVIDQEQGIAMEMPSRKVRLYPSNELLKALEQLKGVTFRLN